MGRRRRQPQSNSFSIWASISTGRSLPGAVQSCLEWAVPSSAHSDCPLTLPFCWLCRAFGTAFSRERRVLHRRTLSASSLHTADCAACPCCAYGHPRRGIRLSHASPPPQTGSPSAPRDSHRRSLPCFAVHNTKTFAREHVCRDSHCVSLDSDHAAGRSTLPCHRRRRDRPGQ